MNDVTAALTAWIEANGYTYDGPMFDIYHVSPLAYRKGENGGEESTEDSEETS